MNSLLYTTGITRMTQPGGSVDDIEDQADG
jgi:hypothetical protein